MRSIRLPGSAALLLMLLATAGCHSAYVEAVIQNRTAGPISLVEVDYPSASFGTEDLKPNADFHYRFKVLGSGDTKVIWTDARHQEHTLGGPALHEGDEGNLSVTFGAGGPVWAKAIKAR